MNHTRTMRRALGVLICGSALVIAAQAQAVQDDSFMKKAAEGNQFEIEAAKLAEQNAQSEQVKQLAQKIASDHQKANEKLHSIASSQGVKLPTEPANSGELKKLAGLKGEKFDQEYLNVMAKDHQSDIKEFQKEASKGKNAEAKNFASQALPTLNNHLHLVQQAQADVNRSVGGSTSGGDGQSK